jgi:hypothetical protein
MFVERVTRAAVALLDENDAAWNVLEASGISRGVSGLRSWSSAAANVAERGSIDPLTRPIAPADGRATLRTCGRGSLREAKRVKGLSTLAERWQATRHGSTQQPAPVIRDPALVDLFDGLGLGLGGRSRGIDEVIPIIDQVGIGLGMFLVTGGLSVLFLIEWSAFDHQRRQHFFATAHYLLRFSFDPVIWLHPTRAALPSKSTVSVRTA